MSDNKENQPLGQSISDIVDRTTTIVHEEIELAKAEIAVSLRNILRGSVAGIVGGVFAFFGLFVLLIGISLLISDIIDFGLWPGFLIVALLLFIFGGLLAFVALKKIKKGSDHIVPEQAIAEAKATKSALKSEIDHQQFDSVAVEETGVTGEASAVTKPAPTAAPKVDPKDAEAAELLAAAKAAVDKPADPLAPTFVTDRKDVPFGEGDKASKTAAKAAAKADKEAAKAQAKADKEAAKAQSDAAKQSAKEMKAAEKEAAKATKAADKAIKKAGNSKDSTDAESDGER